MTTDQIVSLSAVLVAVWLLVIRSIRTKGPRR